MRKRRWLVPISLSFHVVVIFGLYVGGMWQLDRLEAGKRHIDLAIAPPPPPAASGGADRPEPKFDKKQPKEKPPVMVQPTRPTDPVPATAPETTGGAGDGEGSGSGSGSGSGDSKVGDGPCTENCGDPPHEDKKVVVQQERTVSPSVLRGLRIAGDTQIQPPEVVKTEIARDGSPRLVGSFQICLDTAGGVSSIKLAKPTGYPAYDAELRRAISGWRYRPYTLDGQAIPVCGIVTFIYSMK